MIAVVLCTAPHDEVEGLSRALVEEKLVACINVADVKSFFIWEGTFEEDKEALLVMKTTQAQVKGLIKRITELHSYDVPEILALPVIDGHEGYMDWVKETVE